MIAQELFAKIDPMSKLRYRSSVDGHVKRKGEPAPIAELRGTSMLEDLPAPPSSPRLRRFLCLGDPPAGAEVDRGEYPSGVVTLALTDEEAGELGLIEIE